jgi:hypothetical protein
MTPGRVLPVPRVLVRLAQKLEARYGDDPDHSDGGAEGEKKVDSPSERPRRAFADQGLPDLEATLHVALAPRAARKQHDAFRRS